MTNTIDGRPRLLISRQFLPAILGMIHAAERSIILATYVVSPVVAKRDGPAWAVLDALGQAACRHVSVRFVIESTPREKSGGGANRAAVRLLSKMRVQARLGPRPLTVHSKFLVADALYVAIGSHNLTNRSLLRNYETSVLFASRDIALELHLSFQRLWERSDHA